MQRAMPVVLSFLAVPLSAQYRVVYPLSVWPGGIGGLSLDQVPPDDVARQAWAGVKALTPGCLRGGLYYVQYRKAGEVGWTKDPRQIPKGEPVMVDQEGNILRVRCGNGMSKRARLPLVPFLPPPPSEEDRREVIWVPPPHEPLFFPPTELYLPPPPALPDTPPPGTGATAPVPPYTPAPPLSPGQPPYTPPPAGDEDRWGWLSVVPAPLPFLPWGSGGTRQPPPAVVASPEPGTFLLIAACLYLTLKQWGRRL